MLKEFKVKAGKHVLNVEQYNNTYVIRTEKGIAIAFPPCKKGYERVIKSVNAGLFDKQIENIK